MKGEHGIFLEFKAALVGWTGLAWLGTGEEHGIHSIWSFAWTIQQSLAQGVRGCLRMVDEWQDLVVLYRHLCD